MMKRALKKTVLILAGLVMILCARKTLADRYRGGDVKREDAVKIAKEEVTRRRLSLPKNYVANVTDSLAFIEFRPTREIYIVSFAFADHGKQRIVYEINIDKRSGKVDDLTDLRAGTPLR